MVLLLCTWAQISKYFYHHCWNYKWCYFIGIKILTGVLLTVNHHIYGRKQNKTLNSALHLRRRIKCLPNVITLVPSPQADLFSQSKCHEIPCKELGWIPNKQSLSSCRNLNNFIPDEGSRLRNFKPPVCQQTVQRVELICYKHRCFDQKQTMKGREFKTWSEGGYTWIFFSPSHENYWYMWNN